MMLNPATDMASQRGGLSEKQVFEGRVVDNKDPRKLGRVRVMAKGVFDGIPNDKLPWAIPDYAHVGGSSSGMGSFRVPKVGSSIGLKFQNGNPYYPRYVGLNVTDRTAMPEAAHNYPDRIVDLQENGHLVIIDTKTNEVFWRNLGDCHIFITGNVNLEVSGNVVEKITGNRSTFIKGNVIEAIEGNYTQYVSGNVQTKADGNVAAIAGGNFDLGAADMNLRAGHIGLNDPGSAPSVSKPPAPAAAAWPAVRGKVPK